MKWEQRPDGWYLVDSSTGETLDGPYSEQEAKVFAAAAGIPFNTASDRSSQFPVVQGLDSKWYIVDTNTGQIVGEPYATQSQASSARDIGKVENGVLTPGQLPGQTGAFGPPPSKDNPQQYSGAIGPGLGAQQVSRDVLAGGQEAASNFADPTEFNRLTQAGFSAGMDETDIVKRAVNGQATPDDAWLALQVMKGYTPERATTVMQAADQKYAEEQGRPVWTPPTSGQTAAQPVSTTTPASSGASTMQRWMSAPITQGYGPTNEPLDSAYGGYAHFNKGYDYAVPMGTPITSNVSGTVVIAGDDGAGWGTRVAVKDAQGNVHSFGHLDSANVQIGQTVNVGDLLGASGNSGNSTGPHLSYDVTDASGAYIDPTAFVSGSAQTGTSSLSPDLAGVYTQQDIATLYDAAAKAGFTGDALDRAVAAAVAESRDQGFKANLVTGVEDSRGPWQINVLAHPEYANVDLTDPYVAAQAAFKISSGGTDFSPWATYTTAGSPATAVYDALKAGGGTQAQTNTFGAGQPTPVQQTRLDQNQADFDAGRIDEATYYARKDAIQAEIDAAKKARDTARAAAQYDAQKAQEKQALDAYAANLTSQGYRVYHNPDGAPSFYYDAQGRPVPIAYVPERGRVEAGTPGDVNQAEVMRALNEGATYTQQNGTTIRGTSLGSLSPEAAAGYLLAGANGTGVSGVSGSVMKGLDLNSAPTFEQLAGYLGTSLPGTGSTYEGNAALPKDIARVYGAGTTGDWRTQVAAAVTKGATGILEQQRQQQAADLNAQQLQNGTGPGSPTSSNPSPVSTTYSVGPNGVKNELGQYVDQAGNVDGVPLGDGASARVEQRADGFYVWTGTSWLGPYRSWADANGAGLGSGLQPNANNSVNQQLASRTTAPLKPGVDQGVNPNAGVRPLPPVLQPPPPPSQPPPDTPPVVVPPNYGGGPVIYQPAASTSVQTPSAPLSTIVSNFAANPSVLNSVNTAPPSKPLDVAGNVSQIISDQEKRRKRNPFTVAAAPNPFARVA